MATRVITSGILCVGAYLASAVAYATTFAVVLSILIAPFIVIYKALEWAFQ